jgi:hypothetical protein
VNGFPVKPSYRKTTRTKLWGLSLRSNIALVTENKLYAGHKLYDVQPARMNKKDIHWYWAAMELVEEVLTHEQRELLQLKKGAREGIDNFNKVLKVAAYNIEQQTFARMKILDGKTASQTKPTMTGLGGRYIQYCKKNRISMKKGKLMTKIPPKDPMQTGLLGFLVNFLIQEEA